VTKIGRRHAAVELPNHIEQLDPSRAEPSRAEHEELTRLYIIVFFLPTESPFELNPSELEESLAAWRYRFQRHLCQWRSFFQLRRYLGDAEYDSTFLIGHLLYIYIFG
jgi:hypothetical protein